MAKYGQPRKFIAMIRQFHDGMLARVQDNGETSAAFPVSNVVKQGCVLALTLVSLLFSAILTDAFKELNGGAGMRYKYHESLFNLRRLKQEPRFQQIPSTSSCLLIIAPSTLPAKRTCNTALATSLMPATTLGSQSAP